MRIYNVGYEPKLVLITVEKKMASKQATSSAKKAKADTSADAQAAAKAAAQAAAMLERVKAAEPVRLRLLKLIDSAGILQREAAQYIEEQTMRPCSLRSVSSWLAGPAAPKSARPCPAWAVQALELRLRELGKLPEKSRKSSARTGASI